MSASEGADSTEKARIPFLGPANVHQDFTDENINSRNPLPLYTFKLKEGILYLRERFFFEVRFKLRGSDLAKLPSK